MVAVSFGHFSWTVHKDFESCREFLLQIFPSNRQLYEEAFPKIHDINDDVFVLVSRKEAMEKFLQEVVRTMDFTVYRPLYNFLCPQQEMAPLLKKVTRLQAFARQFLVQSTMEEVSSLAWPSCLCWLLAAAALLQHPPICCAVYSQPASHNP